MTPAEIAPSEGLSALRAILWKELRETAKTGAVGFGIVGLGWALVLMLEHSISRLGAASGGPSFPLSLFTFTSAGVGLMIGRAQVLRERRGDAWAFLTHRPVSRSTLFWGKVIVGASLYLIAAGIPLAVALWWQATPGHRPLPFDPRMILPHVADLLAGLVYYFVGLLITMREARWYASRYLPVGAAILCSTLVIGASTFAAALGIVGLGLLLTGTAAWGAFIAGGHYAPQPGASRLGLGVLVGVGLFEAGGIVTGALSLALALGRTNATDLRMTDYEVTSGGVLAKVTRVPRRGVGSANGTTHATTQIFDATTTVVDVRDMAGKPLEQYRDSASRDSSLGAGVISTAAIPLNPNGKYYEYLFGHGYRETDDIFIPMVAGAKIPNTVSWYFMRRLGLIAAYDNPSARLIGWMGPDGFSPDASPPRHRFSGPLRPYTEIEYKQPLLAFPDAVYRLDADRRTITRVHTAMPSETIVGAAGSGDSTSLSAYGPQALFDAVATTSHVYVQSTTGAPEMTVSRDPQSAGYGTLVVTRALRAPGTPTFLRYAPRYGTLSRAQLASATDRITEIGSDGVTLAQYALPPDTSSGVEDIDWPSRIVQGLATPLVQRVAESWYARGSMSASGSTRSTPASREPFVVSWALTLFASLASVIIVIGIGRAYAFDARRLRGWAGVGVALGPLGVLLMLALIERPARERCPACGRERVVTRELCEHCGAPFGVPAPDGTEIFETAVA